MTNYNQEKLLGWLHRVQQRLIGRCSTEVKSYKDGSTMFIVSNDSEGVESWLINNDCCDSDVELVKNEIINELGLL